MLKGIDVNETVDFVSASDTGEDKTIFVIGNILHEDKLKIFSNAVKADGTIDLSGATDKAFDIVIAGLKKIKNLNGKDYSTISKDTLNLLPFSVITEILGKILEFNQLGEVERKN
jgi:hypothetical protein